MKSLERLLVAAAALVGLGLASAQAQSWPDRPVRIIVPIAPGSVTDVIMRAAAQELAPRLGQPVVIDNRPGANGIVGAEACARAAPDGTTLCAVYHAIMSYNPLLVPNLPYDPQRDFTPITPLFFLTEALVVSAQTPVRSVAELRAYAAANPGRLSFGTLGGGSLQELLVAWLNREWRADITPVPYRGGGPIAIAVAANEIQLGNMGLGNFMGGIQAGHIRPLAVATSARSPLLPEVPTFQEAGLGGFPSRGWWGLAGPRGLPRPVVDRANAAFATLFREPRFVAFLQQQAVQPQVASPEAFQAFLQEDRRGAEALVAIAGQPPAR